MFTDRDLSASIKEAHKTIKPIATFLLIFYCGVGKGNTDSSF